MLFKALSLLFVVGTVLAATPNEARVQTDAVLLDLMLSPRGDPAVESYCWGRYTPIMKEIIDVFESESKKCQSDYDTSNAAIIAKYSVIRTNVTEIAKNSCQSLQKCDGLPSQLDAFNCFGAAGREQSQILTAMSGDSLKAAISLEEETSSITSIQRLCSEKAYANYTTDNSKTVKELTDCLDGNVAAV